MNFDITGPESSLERLDDGIFFEVIGVRHEITEIENEDDLVFGCAEADMLHWSYQLHENADGITCLKYVIDQLTSLGISEEEICSRMESLGCLDPEGGISGGDMLLILESYGFVPEYAVDTSLRELMEMLDSGKVICPVNSCLLEPEGVSPYEGSSANAYVQVIGINIQDPLNQSVCLNVPFDRNGGGKVYDLQTFSRAWKAGNKAAIYIDRRDYGG